MSPSYVEEKHPLKQGLKPNSSLRLSANIIVEEKHPLKQGLKQIILFILQKPLTFVEEKHPLKQGLKHILYMLVVYSGIR